MKEIVKCEDGKVSINKEVLNNLIGEEKVINDGRIFVRHGVTKIDITKAIKDLKQSENAPTYIIMLTIIRGTFNTHVKFVEVKTDLPQDKIIDHIFKRMIVTLPGDERVIRNLKHRKYFGKEDGFTFLALSKDHAYIYVGKKLREDEKYSDSFFGMNKYVNRTRPNSETCSLM